MASKIIKGRVAGLAVGALALDGSGAARSAWGPDVTAAPTIQGTLKVGQTLTASGGSWTGPYGTTTSYQWLRCPDAGSVYDCALLSGSVAQTCRLVNDDQAKMMRVALIARTDSQYDYAKAAKVTRLSTFQRTYRAGARIAIRISKPGYVSKVTVLQIRRGAAPLRTDGCLYPGHRKLQRCPS